MIGWIIFAAVVMAIVGWRAVGFFRRRQTEAKRRKERELDCAYEAHYSDPAIIQWQKQTHEEFKKMMRW